MSGTLSRSFFLPTILPTPIKRFAAAKRLHHAPQVARAACVRGYDARAAKRSSPPQLPPPGGKASRKIRFAAATASPPGGKPLPQAARAAPKPNVAS